MDPDPDFLDQIQIFGHSGSRQKKSYLDRGKNPDLKHWFSLLNYNFSKNTGAGNLLVLGYKKLCFGSSLQQK